MSRLMHHRKAARVLPVPVGARMRVDSPRAMAGQPSCWGRVGAEKTASNQARTGGWKRWRGSVGMVIDFRDHSAPRDFSVLNHSPSFLFVRGCECAMWKGDRGQTGLTANFRQSAPEIHVSLVSPRGVTTQSAHSGNSPPTPPPRVGPLNRNPLHQIG